LSKESPNREKIVHESLNIFIHKIGKMSITNHQNVVGALQRPNGILLHA
jgi:hypothetical protein